MFAEQSKKVFISGVSRGVGQAMARSFLEKGYEVFGCSRSKLGEQMVHHYVCDLSQPESINQMCHEIREQDLSFDVLINNAGIAGANSLDPASDDAHWFNVIATNLHAPYLLSKGLRPCLGQGASIINVTSVLSHIGLAEQSAYATAKHGLLGLTRSLAKAYAVDGIRVNAIAPGWIDTDMARSRMKELKLTESELCEPLPLKRMVQTKEVAAMALYLSNEDAVSITGQSFVIDAGMLC